MRFLPRKKEAIDAASVDVPFESLRRSPRNTRKKPETGFEAGAALDPAESGKTRARHRLIGAVALGMAAIVFVPMLFDRTPVAPVDDIDLQIPSRDTPFEGRRGVPDPGKAPLRPSAAPNAMTEAPAPATARADASPQPVEPAPVVAERSVEAADKPVDKPVDAPAKAPVVPKVAAVEKPASVVDKPAAPVRDDPRAIAALEGKAEPATESSGSKTYAVQIAAFSAADKARGLRDQLVASGLRSYTESVSTTQGLRTRVRLGPFATREAADQAKQKLRTMKLDGSVVPL